MTFFEKIVFALQIRGESPASYGSFHLISIALCILTTVLLCIFARGVNEKTFRLIIAISWGIMLIFEIYKQLVYSFNAETLEWTYQWYSFPFQLCSTPLYLLPLVAFMKEGKIRDGIMMFISTFAFFGGVCVMVFPNDVFRTSLVGIHIQTMLHHGLQIALGIYIAVYNRKRLNKESFIISVIIFAILTAVALIGNVIVHSALPESGFNMFYISPYYACTLPLLSEVYKATPYIVFLLVYILGFVLCAVIMRLLILGGIKLCEFLSNKIKGNK